MKVAAFYKFTALDGLEALQGRLAGLARALELKGTVLLAAEGVNAALCGSLGRLQRFVSALQADERIGALPVSYSAANPGNPVFHRLKVRVRPEIVNFGRPEVNPKARTGQHVDAWRWNALLEDPDATVLDARNAYEIRIGAFPGRLDPGTRVFREFPAFAAQRLNPKEHRRIAMYCTGGIRCEKASAHLLNAGFEEVYQLQGGILKYLETAPAEDNRWQGECFVFDQRVSVDGQLRQGRYRQCFACRAALSPENLASPHYRPGVCCPHCHGALSEARRAGFEERHRQVQLAAARGERHIGGA